MRRIVEEAGGPKRCVDNDEALKKLVEKSGEVMRNINDMRMSLRKEIAEDLDDAFKKNFKLFSRKLEAQERELGERIDASGAHVIAELSRGAHDDIKDQVHDVPFVAPRNSYSIQIRNCRRSGMCRPGKPMSRRAPSFSQSTTTILQSSAKWTRID